MECCSTLRKEQQDPFVFHDNEVTRFLCKYENLLLKLIDPNCPIFFADIDDHTHSVSIKENAFNVHREYGHCKIDLNVGQGPGVRTTANFYVRRIGNMLKTISIEVMFEGRSMIPIGGVFYCNNETLIDYIRSHYASLNDKTIDYFVVTVDGVLFRGEILKHVQRQIYGTNH